MPTIREPVQNGIESNAQSKNDEFKAVIAIVIGGILFVAATCVRWNQANSQEPPHYRIPPVAWSEADKPIGRVALAKDLNHAHVFRLDADQGENIWVDSEDGTPMEGTTWVNGKHPIPLSTQKIDEIVYSTAYVANDPRDAGVKKLIYWKWKGTPPPSNWREIVRTQY